MPTRSSVLVRPSHSHIRIGTFQRLAYHGETTALGQLLDYTIETYMPELWRESVADRAAAFLEEVCRWVAATGTAWMVAGFVHGVLNTDKSTSPARALIMAPGASCPCSIPRSPRPISTRAAYTPTGASRTRYCGPDPGGGVPASARQPGSAACPPRPGIVRHRDGPGPGPHLVGLDKGSGIPFERAFFDWHGGAHAARAEAGPEAAQHQAPGFAPVRRLLGEHVPAPEARLDHPCWQRPAPVTMLIEDVEALWAPIAADDDWSRLYAKLGDVGRCARRSRPPLEQRLVRS